MAVAWLADLEDALFAQLPQTDPAFVWEGETYLCERALEDRNGAITLVEVWRDQRTERAVMTWRVPIDPGAWIGASPQLQATAIVTLLLCLDQMRPRKRVFTREDAFVPSRFGIAPRQTIR